LAPGWTDYNQRIMIQAYNVTHDLVDGDNVLGAQLSEGWYAGNVGPFGVDHYGTEPRLWMQLRIKYSDGSYDQLVTDESWSISRGPIQFSDIIYGEIYDARLEQTGWDSPGFAAEGWMVPKIEALNNKVFVGQLGPGVEIIETLKPRVVEEKFSGVSSIDVGQNISGLLRLRLQGSEGTRVTIRHAEMLQEDGSLFMQNLRGARQTDTYILRGANEEWYQPTFTYHGFQYADVTGLDYILTSDDVDVQVIHSAIKPSGKLSTSNPLVNQLISNAVWSQRDNFLSVPTDCPQRDERLGWLGDAQFFAATAAYNMDVAAFFEKWMRDVTDGQQQNGGFPDIAPNVSSLLGSGNAAWADAGIIIPWTMYLMYGDRALIKEMYPSMQRYMDFLQTASVEGIRPNAGFGDWLSIGKETPKDIMQTAYYAYSATLMKKMAVILGHETDADKYENTLQIIHRSFQAKYVEQDGRIKGNTQTCYVLALQMGVLDSAQQIQAVNHLVADIEANDYHITTGITSTVYLLPVLTRHGHHKVAMKLLLQETYPGWLYSVHQGATTIWERWDGWNDERGFQSAGMNSFNHYAIGAVLEWMYRDLAGITPVEVQPGFAHIHLRPHPDRSLPVVEASYESVHGLIESWWKYTDTGWEWRVTIPANVTAVIELPEADSSKLTESGMPLGQADGISSIKLVNDHIRLEAGSGSYRFVMH
jgi:alpha-L-rhamnosidase